MSSLVVVSLCVRQIGLGSGLFYGDRRRPTARAVPMCITQQSIHPFRVPFLLAPDVACRNVGRHLLAGPWASRDNCANMCGSCPAPTCIIKLESSTKVPWSIPLLSGRIGMAPFSSCVCVRLNYRRELSSLARNGSKVGAQVSFSVAASRPARSHRFHGHLSCGRCSCRLELVDLDTLETSPWPWAPPLSWRLYWASSVAGQMGRPFNTLHLRAPVANGKSRLASTSSRRAHHGGKWTNSYSSATLWPGHAIGFWLVG